eukprot:TRINITY_DN2156_c0_g1_i2.p1 TRINITY_DN2156_c0_g1~~TRINITY_DN2156_c0_g1_i2.p1  ORF type:complete len:517 (+),score=106.57 TRINITY_DN2156_c0_g1_i2:179-1729(+)
MCIRDRYQRRVHGGPKLEKMNFFSQPKVQKVIFSPNEDYVLSYNGSVHLSGSSQNFIVWNVLTASKIRTWKSNKFDDATTFQWNFDGQYLAQVSDHQVCVYEMPECKYALNKNTNNREPIFMPNVQKICWNSRNNLLCCAAYEGDLRQLDQKLDPTKTSKISFFDIPNFTEMKWKSINIQVTQMDLYCSEKGAWFSAVLKCRTNQKKSIQIQVANLKKRDVVEVITQEFTDKIKSVQFDQMSGRFAVIAQVQKKKSEKDKESKQISYLIAKFYQILEGTEDGNKNSLTLKQVGQYDDIQSSNFSWAKYGNFFVVANTEPGPNNGIIQFGALTKQGNNHQFTVQVYRTLKYAYLTDVSWDDAGRYFLASSLIKNDNKNQPNSYEIYDAKSEFIFKDSYSNIGFKNVQFRPRPKVLIDAKEEQKIQDNQKEYHKKYEKADYEYLHKVEIEAQQKKDSMKKQFLEYLGAKRKMWASSTQERIQLKGFDEDKIDNNELVTDEVIQDIQVVSEQVIQSAQE